MIFQILLFTILLSHKDANPEELGNVQWLRSYDVAVEKSKAECKPILILFQEVPGCHTCRQYGNTVLSNELIVEAIETQFIPLAIFNNKGGHDADILKKYNEPAWNNPVVRIVNEKGIDIVSRLNGNYSAHGLTDKMVTALVSQQGKSPVYLQLLADELSAKNRGTATVTYSMHCFWSGEALFGKLNGVVATTAGWQNGKEVVQVEYDPAIITRSQLDKISTQLSCKPMPAGDMRPDATPKYYLSHHKYNKLNLTEIQKCRINSALAEGQDPDVYLSPRQIKSI